jgi:hypothetical protein
MMLVLNTRSIVVALRDADGYVGVGVVGAFLE